MSSHYKNLLDIYFGYLTLGCTYIAGILPEVSVDPMKVIEDALLEFSDKKDLFLAYMSTMLIGDQGNLFPC